jgi:hypothetical protein
MVPFLGLSNETPLPVKGSIFGTSQASTNIAPAGSGADQAQTKLLTLCSGCLLIAHVTPLRNSVSNPEGIFV